MQSAETVLGVLRERGKRGLPCTQLYRQLFNPQLYLLAYGRIYANKGAMTSGARSASHSSVTRSARISVGSHGHSVSSRSNVIALMGRVPLCFGPTLL